ncbi:MAG: DUF362 domain-containing protein [Acidobacteriota bacterium]|jgi:uncharacterized protein (DUF362 family)
MDVRTTPPLDRRDFIKGAAAGIALLPHTGLGSLAFGAPQQRSTVAVIHTDDRRDGVTRAFELLQPSGIAGKHVVIKPNFNTADPTPAGTHNDTLAQLVTELQERDARAVTLGESSGPPATDGVMEQKGIPDMAACMDFDVVNFEEIPDADWLPVNPAGTHWPEGFYLPRQVVDAEYLVSTCCLKTHGFGGVFTMSLKLSVGLTPKSLRRGMHRSPDMRRMIAELNQGYRPQLIVLDGVEAFTDGGPSSGELKTADVFIAGSDRVAVDAVGLAMLKHLGANEDIMSRPIFAQEQIARAVEVRLGVTGPDEIRLVSDDPAGWSYAETLNGILAQG